MYYVFVLRKSSMEHSIPSCDLPQQHFVVNAWGQTEHASAPLFVQAMYGDGGSVAGAWSRKRGHPCHEAGFRHGGLQPSDRILESLVVAISWSQTAYWNDILVHGKMMWISLPAVSQSKWNRTTHARRISRRLTQEELAPALVQPLRRTHQCIFTALYFQKEKPFTTRPHHL